MGAGARRTVAGAVAGEPGAPPLLAAGYLDKRGRRTRSRVRRWFVVAGGELFNARSSAADPSWRVGLAGGRVAACGLTGKLVLVLGRGRLVLYVPRGGGGVARWADAFRAAIAAATPPA
ncbi:hypothetical protein MMPV_009066 [Pyropia vietnamensis]